MFYRDPGCVKIVSRTWLCQNCIKNLAVSKLYQEPGCVKIVSRTWLCQNCIQNLAVLMLYHCCGSVSGVCYGSGFAVVRVMTLAVSFV